MKISYIQEQGSKELTWIPIIDAYNKTEPLDLSFFVLYKRGSKMKRRRKKIIRRKRRRHDTLYLLLIFILLITLFLIRKCVFKDSKQLPILIEKAAAFNISGDVLYELKKISEVAEIDFVEAVVLYSLENDFNVDENSTMDKKELYKFCIEDMNKIRKKYNKKDVQKLYTIYYQSLVDVNVFPVPDIGEYIYANSWGAARDYGGKRKHLGTDIIDVHNKRGSIPIVSMTDGIVEQMGWNEKGGWRVGIRAPSGAYFYYAHLDSYSSEISEGKEIKSGQCLGYMGDSGYGKEPGTIGNFPVHLHLGIMVDVSFLKEELWINPYSILKFAEYNKISWNSTDENS